MRLLLLTLILLLGTLIRAQSQPDLEGFQHLGIRTNYTYFEDHSSFYGIGPAFHVNITDRLILNYHVQFGGDERGKFHVHSYLGGATSFFLALWALEEQKDEGLKSLGAVLSLIVPEGVAYNAEIGDDTYLEPYVNPLGLHIASNQYFSGEFGTRVRLKAGKWNFMPFVGGEVLYIKSAPIGIGGGLTVSYQMSD